MSTSRNQEWREIWEAKGRRTTEELHAIDGYDLLNSAEWEGMIATLMAPVALRPGLSVVELGCGAGAFLSALLRIEPGLRIAGLDYASSLIEVARARLPGSFLVGDIQDCPAVATASADFTCSFGVLLYLDSEADVRRALAEIDRVTKPGGQIYLGEISDLAKREEALVRRQSTHAGHRKVSTKEVDHLYLPKELFRAEADRLGWSDVRICDHADLPPLAANPLASYRYSVYAKKNRERPPSLAGREARRGEFPAGAARDEIFELKTLVYSKGKWVPGDAAAAPAYPTPLGEIWRFYGNLIDYARVALALAAACLITGPAPFAAAALILASFLLDWIDGPVARKFNQCTLFGSGVDWLADVLGQAVTLIWWARLAPWVTPFIVAFTAVEMALSIFDFALTARGTYPTYRGKLAKRFNGWFAILDWSIPDGSYSRFGTFLWLAYPFFSVVSCLKLAQPRCGQALEIAQAALLLPAILYMWCETAYLCFILRNWAEPARS